MSEVQGPGRHRLMPLSVMAPEMGTARCQQRAASLLRTLLVLGRVSNLPTVWSNCLAAWLIAGGERWSALTITCAGVSLLYTGGMYLNDAFDVDFDRRFRPERPIVSGQIPLRSVWVLGWIMLLCGAAVLWAAATRTGLFGLALLGLIVIYDAVHKRTSLAPVLMAGCRFLVYVLAASSVAGSSIRPVVIAATALAAYILGLSSLARVESTTALSGRWPYLLLLAPTLTALMAASGKGVVIAVAAAQAGWVLWGLLAGARARHRFFSAGVSGLLAGIVLVDWLAASCANSQWFVVFGALWLLALLLQRFAPAT